MDNRNLYQLLDYIVKDGITSYGARFAEKASEPLAIKGKGYFGLIPSPEGYSTEISSTDEFGRSYPMLSPNMTESDIRHLITMDIPTEDMYNKAEQWAEYRRLLGKDPFATPTELRIPIGAFSGLLGE